MQGFPLNAHTYNGLLLTTADVAMSPWRSLVIVIVVIGLPPMVPLRTLCPLKLYHVYLFSVLRHTLHTSSTMWEQALEFLYKSMNITK